MIGKKEPESIATLTVYCDAHASLIKVVSDFALKGGGVLRDKYSQMTNDYLFFFKHNVKMQQYGPLNV